MISPSGGDEYGQITDYIPSIERRGYSVRLLRYGQYFPDEYLSLLRQTCVMVGFTPDESQGIAWAEAWSVNVPTLLWKQEKVTYKGRTYRAVDSALPYATDWLVFHQRR